MIIEEKKNKKKLSKEIQYNSIQYRTEWYGTTDGSRCDWEES